MTRQVPQFSSFANQLQIILLQCAKQVSNTKAEVDQISLKLRDEMRSLKYFETLEESYRKKIGEFG